MDVRKGNELVLVFKEELMYGFSGLLSDDYPDSLDIHGLSERVSDIQWLDDCIKRAFYMPRKIVEENPEYKQIIPYIVVRHNGSVFAYSRDGAESRLTKRVSIGIGGHINPCDQMSLSGAAYRELSEELDLGDMQIHSKMIMKHGLSSPDAVLYAGKSGDIVNSVHIGAVFFLNLTEGQAAAATLLEEGKQLEWMTAEDLKNCEDLEEWSRLVVAQCL